MKQVLQNLKNGQTILAEIPAPKNTKGNILISSSVSLISAGTEKMLIDFGKSGYLEKARKQPDKVKQVFDKIKIWSKTEHRVLVLRLPDAKSILISCFRKLMDCSYPGY